jgi:hypothetical protein
VWIKTVAAVVLLSGVGAGLVFLIHHPGPAARTVTPSPAQPPPTPGQTAASPQQASGSDTGRESTGKRSRPSGMVSTAVGKMTGQLPKPSVSRDIPVPPHSEPPPRPTGTDGALSVEFANGEARAGDKSPGSLYVSLRISAVSDYRGTVTEKDLSAVREALEGTKKIKVFVGGYMIKGGRREVGQGNIAAVSAGFIYYFDPELAKSCEAVRAIIANVTAEPMRCASFGVDPTSMSGDIVRISGLDMEIWL